MRKITYITGTRADFGLMQNTLQAIDNHPNLKLSLIVTGMHLMPEFGNTLKEVKSSGFRYSIAKATYKKDNRASMANFIGRCIIEIVKTLRTNRPDILLLLGDRAEMLAGTIAGTYMGIPIAHIHGGEVTSTVDEVVRHAITKLSYIHLPSNKNSAERILKMGEDKSRVFVVGAPGLEQIRQYTMKKNQKQIVLLYHPDGSVKECRVRIKLILDVLKDIGLKTIIIYPNADAGGRAIIEEINKRVKLFETYENIPHNEFLGILNATDVLVGNSSAGIIEAPSFKLPVVNIGLRQDRRERASNVIDVNYNKQKIKDAINKALTTKLDKCINPYSKGDTSRSIAKILSKVKIKGQKQITY